MKSSTLLRNSKVHTGREMAQCSRMHGQSRVLRASIVRSLASRISFRVCAAARACLEKFGILNNFD